MKTNPQIQGLHTIIRDKDCSREDFIFYSNRLIRLAIEEALALLAYEEKDVTTPTGAVYKGLKWTGKIAGVSILTSGQSMEAALREGRIGKILIQRNEEDASAILYYPKMPADIE